MNTHPQAFTAYAATVARYVGRTLVNARMSELLAMFACGVSPMAAAWAAARDAQTKQFKARFCQ